MITPLAPSAEDHNYKCQPDAHGQAEVGTAVVSHWMFCGHPWMEVPLFLIALRSHTLHLPVEATFLEREAEAMRHLKSRAIYLQIILSD